MTEIPEPESTTDTECGLVPDGASVLDEVAEFVNRYVATPSPEATDALVLWAVHTHAIEAADTTPRLAVLSPEKRSGKTRLFEVLCELVRAPLLTSSISTSSLFRCIDKVEPPECPPRPLECLRIDAEGIRVPRGGSYRLFGNIPRNLGALRGAEIS